MKYQIEQKSDAELKYLIEQESGIEQEEGEEPVDDDDEQADIQRHSDWEPPDYFLG